MNCRTRFGGLVSVVWSCALVVCVSPGRAAESPAQRAKAILDATGVKGGLVVHLGCGDGKLTAALRANDSYFVHGLDASAANVEMARKLIQSLGVYGKVSVDRCAADRLPYVDNLVNLLIAEDLGEIPMAEVIRVLAPNGVGYVKSGGTWRKTIKPRPKDIDEWTHYLHDASGNAVARDSVVGPPRRLQWVGSPRWSRHHDRMASMSALVSTGGRIFYIIDEGPTASVQLPPRWVLVARDAFNGTILWKRPMGSWYTHLWPFKSGPAQLPRHLIAIDDRVYVTLALDAPLTALDAATGKTIRTYESSKATEEVIASDGVLFLLVNDSNETPKPYRPIQRNIGQAKQRVAREWPWDEKPRWIMAVQADTGQVVWRKRYVVEPLTLAANAQSVFFHDGEKVLRLNRKNGEEIWQSDPIASRSPLPTAFAPTLVVYEDVVVFGGGRGKMSALSLETGKTLWTAKHPRSGHSCPQDVLVIDGLVWSGATAGGKDSGVFTGRDLHTGEVASEFPPDVQTYWFHHRCYRSKATDRYIMPSRTGIEFVEFRKKHWTINHWVRGGCVYGIMPCNGLVYAPPHDCACYLESKLSGLCALAPEAKNPPAPEKVPDEGRLELGPAKDEPYVSSTASPRRDDWPTYRHDSARSGSTTARVPAELERAWRTELGGKLTGVVTAGDKAFVASVDTHTLYALDAATGKVAWRYTAGGRIDSPPTIHLNRVLFGCADGWVYCIRAADGELIWRFRAAPVDRRLMAFEQLESVWPVHGSVLVQDGVLYCVAGRSMFLDGGMRLLRLDPKNGRKLSETILDDRDPETGENLQVRVKVLNMPVALPDVLSGDGRHVYMRSQRFEPDGKRESATPAPMDPTELAMQQTGEDVHLFCPGGFLDDTWFHRNYWVFGRRFSSGCNWYFRAGRYAPAGRILVFDDASVYGYGRKAEYFQWTTPLEYQLFATSTEIPPAVNVNSAARRRGGTSIHVAKSKSLNPTGKPLTVEAWIKAERPDGAIVARGGASHGYALLVKGGKPRFAIRVDGKPCAVVAKGVIDTGAWVHLAGVLSTDKTLSIYVNGELAGSAEAIGLLAADPHQPMDIGADEGSSVGAYKGQLRFTGLIDEVKIYHCAISADEIKRHAIAAGPAPAKETDLVLHFTFDNQDAADASGNKNDGVVAGAQPVKGKFGGAMRFTSREREQGITPMLKYRWAEAPPLHVRAMVLADQTLFVAGPPDVLDEEEAFKHYADAAIQSKLFEQRDAIEGRKGALLRAVATADGKTLTEYHLDAPPVWDGLSATPGRLYLTTTTGQVICMAGKR